MGNCGCYYFISQTDVVVSKNTEIQSSATETDNNHLYSQTLKNTASLGGSKKEIPYKLSTINSSVVSSFKKKGPILVKLQLKNKSHKKIL